MQYRVLGKSGLKISALSFGSYLTFGHHVHDNNAENLMALAYDSGVNYFDTAEVYALGEAENMIGRCLKKIHWPRDTYIMGTKVFWGGEQPTQIGLHRKHIIEACNASLKRLGLDYVDFLFCHRPDPETAIEETVLAMYQLIQQGKILYWGTSEWTLAQIAEAHKIAKQNNHIAPSIEQIQYNMCEQSKGQKAFIEPLKEMGIGITTTMPLASGVLTGKYNGLIPNDSRIKQLKIPGIQELVSQKITTMLPKIQSLTIIAKELNISLAQLAIAWCLKNNDISSVILGASNEKQLLENLESLNATNKLDASVMQMITDLEISSFFPKEPSHFSYDQVLSMV